MGGGGRGDSSRAPALMLTLSVNSQQAEVTCPRDGRRTPGSPERKEGPIALKDGAACHLLDCDKESHCHKPWTPGSQRKSPQLCESARSAIRNWREQIWQHPEGTEYSS